MPFSPAAEFAGTVESLGAGVTQFAVGDRVMGYAGYGAAGALVRMPGFEPGGNSVLVYFSCADCAVEADKAAARVRKLDLPANLIAL